MAVITTVNYFENITAMSSGITGTTSYGPTWRITIGGTWATADTLTFSLVTDNATYTLGAGRVTSVTPVASITLQNRVHFVAGRSWYGSDNGDPTGWEQQAPGAFVIDLSANAQIPDNLVSLAAYQGRMVVMARRNIQIWSIDADPNNFALQQVLNNIGTFSPLGLQSLGDLDVLFPSDTGIRSLRVRETTLNAYVSDLGTAIDTLVQAAIVGQSASTLSGAVGVVEPTSNRYFLWLPGSTTIYVFSYFPSSKIAAWSTYLATTSVTNVQTNLTPIKFVVYAGQVYLRATRGGSDYVFVLGGTNGTTYDNCVANIQTPFVDAKRPGHKKNAQAIDVDVTGTWQCAATPDWINGTLITADTAATKATFDQGSIPFAAEGTHFSMEAQTTGSTAAKVSSMMLYYTLGEAPVDD